MKRSIRQIISDNKPYLIKVVKSVSFIIGLFVLMLLLKNPVIYIFKNVSFLEPIYDFVSYEIKKRSYLGVFLITFFGNTFLLGYPGEVLFLSFLEFGYNVFSLILVELTASMIAQVLNYYFGYFLEKTFFKRFYKKKDMDYIESKINQSKYAIIFLNVPPVPGDILTVFLGMVKYDVKKTMIYTIIGKLIKYFFLIMFFVIINSL